MADVVFSRAKVAALLGLCALPGLTERLKAELLHHGEGYLLAALTLADIEYIDPVRCGAVLEQVLCTAPAVVISELSGQVVDEATVGLLRKLRPLSPPVKEGYLDVLEKLKLPEPRALLSSPVGMGGTASWMIFEFPAFLLRLEILTVLDCADTMGWPMDPARPSYEFADLMDDVRAIALTIEGNKPRENAFVASLASAREPRNLAQVTTGWRDFACSIKSSIDVMKREFV